MRRIWMELRQKLKLVAHKYQIFSVGDAVASDTRGPRFESSNWHNFILPLFWQLFWNPKNIFNIFNSISTAKFQLLRKINYWLSSCTGKNKSFSIFCRNLCFSDLTNHFINLFCADGKATPISQIKFSKNQLLNRNIKEKSALLVELKTHIRTYKWLISASFSLTFLVHFKTVQTLQQINDKNYPYSS